MQHVDFLTACKMFFINYANFKGRSTRAEYWWAFLMLFILGAIGGLFPPLAIIIQLGCFIPSLAILTRRFHDTGRSGWQVLGIYVLVAICYLVLFFPLMKWIITYGATAAQNPAAYQALHQIMEGHLTSIS